jgi:hypothetical protein
LKEAKDVADLNQTLKKVYLKEAEGLKIIRRS